MCLNHAKDDGLHFAARPWHVKAYPSRAPIRLTQQDTMRTRTCVLGHVLEMAGEIWNWELYKSHVGLVLVLPDWYFMGISIGVSVPWATWRSHAKGKGAKIIVFPEAALTGLLGGGWELVVDSPWDERYAAPLELITGDNLKMAISQRKTMETAYLEGHFGFQFQGQNQSFKLLAFACEPASVLQLDFKLFFLSAHIN